VGGEVAAAVLMNVEPSQRDGSGGGCAAAIKPAAAVASGARELLVRMRASSACPDLARPGVGWSRDGNTSLGFENGADALKGGVARERVDGWPDSGGAFVDQG
jgi:hypothetical protein